MSNAMVLSGGGNIIGFIGAGKAGCSLARYFMSKGERISGMYERDNKAVQDAKEVINGLQFFDTADELVLKSEIIFITVTDTAIGEVWNGLDKRALRNKIVCHCSGSLTTDIFADADPDRVCSVHPMLAFNSKSVSIERISRAYFTLQGGKYALDSISELLNKCKNKYRVIDKSAKVKYHAAACFAANFSVAVCAEAFELLGECGFSENEAKDALSELIEGNARNICEKGVKGALTGPVARGDALTLRKHMAQLDGDRLEMYKLLSRTLARAAGTERELLEELK